MKKIVFMTLVLMMCFYSNIMVFASEEDKVITIDEYETTIKNEMEKYGIECSFIEYKPGVIITEDNLRTDIYNLKMYAERINKEENLNIQPSLVKESREEVLPYLMPVTKDVSNSHTIVSSSNIGSASIRVDANVTVNAQNDNVMSINSLDAYQYGYFINFVSWETTSITGIRNYIATGYISVNVQGRATFSYSTSLGTVGLTEDIAFTTSIDCR